MMFTLLDGTNLSGDNMKYARLFALTFVQLFAAARFHR